MQSKLKLALLALTMIIGVTAFAQQGKKSTSNSTNKVAKFKAEGSCEMCKKRIQDAAKIDGVSNARWDQKSKTLSVVYNPSKVKADDIQKKVAAAGHDTDKFKADNKTYNSLPGCCKYRK